MEINTTSKILKKVTLKTFFFRRGWQFSRQSPNFKNWKIGKGKQKKEKVIGHAKKDLDKILTHFKENELKIGKELTTSYEATQKQETLIGKCNLCDGDLRIIYSRKNKSYFIACSKYPECKNTFSLPRYALPKPANETCPECSSPLVLMIRKGKRPYKFCIGRDCPAKKRWFEQMQEKDKEEGSGSV